MSAQKDKTGEIRRRAGFPDIERGEITTVGRFFGRYVFDWKRIQCEDAYHVEYSITDICNRNCAFCSHLAPLAKKDNFVDVEEFTRVTRILKKCIPDVHTFWLTGGEPTLHPEFLRLLAISRGIYPNSYIGIYSNGITLKKYETDEGFWTFVRENGIVWGITCYDIEKSYFEGLFSGHGCLENLAIVQSGKYFFQLTNYSFDQPVTVEKYEKCGWERSKINVRNGKIYNCPSSEFADLFNGYFGEELKICESDYLVVDENLTRERIEAFRGAIPFCSQCNIERRYKKIYWNEPSKRDVGEWSEFKNKQGDK